MGSFCSFMLLLCGLQACNLMLKIEAALQNLVQIMWKAAVMYDSQHSLCQSILESVANAVFPYKSLSISGFTLCSVMFDG